MKSPTNVEGSIMISRTLAAACAATLLASATAAGAAPLYSLSFLPIGFQAEQVNDGGQIVGRADGAAALYSGGVVTTVAPVGSYGWGINNRGDIVGSLNQAVDSEAFTWIDGTLTNIDPLVAGPNAQSYGFAINDHGVVGGFTYTGGESTPGFLFQNGVVEPIGTFGGDYSPLAAINSHGAATGYAAFPGPAGGTFHAYIYQDGTLQDLGTLGIANSRGTDINDLGQVAGYAGSTPFLYSGGSMIELGSLGGGGGYAYALNDAGVVVGASYVTPSESSAHAFVWADGAMTDLNTLVDSLGGWELTEAQDINESGQILGTACLSGNCTSVLLTPVPEPAAGLLLLAGLALAPLAVRRRRQGYLPSQLEA
jgi:probable HAF family extracellular repeat protein